MSTRSTRTVVMKFWMAFLSAGGSVCWNWGSLARMSVAMSSHTCGVAQVFWIVSWMTCLSIVVKQPREKSRVGDWVREKGFASKVIWVDDHTCWFRIIWAIWVGMSCMRKVLGDLPEVLEEALGGETLADTGGDFITNMISLIVVRIPSMRAGCETEGSCPCQLKGWARNLGSGI